MSLRVRLHDNGETLGVMNYPDHTLADVEALNGVASAVHEAYVNRRLRNNQPVSPFLGCVVEFVPEDDSLSDGSV